VALPGAYSPASTTFAFIESGKPPLYHKAVAVENDDNYNDYYYFIVRNVLYDLRHKHMNQNVGVDGRAIAQAVSR
jgi:hypothetical protein